MGRARPAGVRCGKSVDDVSLTGDVVVFGPSTSHCSSDRKTVAETQKRVIKRSGRNALSRLFHAGNDKETIMA